MPTGRVGRSWCSVNNESSEHRAERSSPYTCVAELIVTVDWLDSVNLLKRLRKLEVELHQPEVRSNANRLSELLHESFTEIGRSGQRYSRSDILEQLPVENRSGTVWSGQFSVEEIVPDLALLTYISAQIDASGGKSRRTLRSSLWQRTSKGWQVRFHQGTPAPVGKDCST